MRCEIAVDIDSCPDHVWAVITDLNRWPRWTTAVREAALLGGGTLALHGVVRLRAPRLPERTWRVAEFQGRRHRFTLRHEGVGGHADVRFALVATGVSRSRLVVTHDRSGWLGSPMARITARTVEANLQLLAGDLKEHCESRRRSGVVAPTG
ncbi:polyketide cyclase/dehydrase/lipid transport protein [Actinomycetospora succinea]|uniref:Polyketide cyclase/dehydrase/lipid transport protein n=1 Tax=Actinomycetospora succinea TaxID=663603 RepID=A0A4R6UU97_9PSEU|nr:SRPBCC family protein [Actinomycetospora succinea]TDQ48945.1 polyketide cyclase/dehydrase/lipid transport protein [Actinomycetospora succinea]